MSACLREDPRRRLESDLCMDELLRMREEGLSNREIADRLGVSRATIYKYLGRQPAGIRYKRPAGGKAAGGAAVEATAAGQMAAKTPAGGRPAGGATVREPSAWTPATRRAGAAASAGERPMFGTSAPWKAVAEMPPSGEALAEASAPGEANAGESFAKAPDGEATAAKQPDTETPTGRKTAAGTPPSGEPDAERPAPGRACAPDERPTLGTSAPWEAAAEMPSGEALAGASAPREANAGESLATAPDDRTPATGAAAAGQSTAETLAGGRPAGGTPAVEKPAVEAPFTGKPPAGTPAGGKPTAGAPDGDAYTSRLAPCRQVWLGSVCRLEVDFADRILRLAPSTGEAWDVDQLPDIIGDLFGLMRLTADSGGTGHGNL